MTYHPFRFGVVVGQQHEFADLPATAREIEGRGYSTLLLPDTLYTPSPFPGLAAAAAATTTLGVGSWVLASPYRIAGEVVRDTQALQQISSDRFELGVGAGRPGGERDAKRLGVPWGSPKERVDAVEETLAAVAESLAPAPHIVVAGMGPRMMRIAGRYADTVAVGLSPLATEDELVAATDRVRRAAGPRADTVELNLQITGIGEALPTWITQQMGLSAAELRERGAVGLMPGDPAAAADRLRHLRERTGISYLTVPSQFADTLAPLIPLLGLGA